jgi:pyruvate dehydrogenase E1 component alpha subunit
MLYEVMNMAALWKLPVIYVCENNLYNEYTHYTETTAGDITARAEAFGIRTEVVDGQSVVDVCTIMQQLVERARRGEGPSFLLCNTYRYYGHHVGDVNRSYYRSKQEEQEWKTQHDPIQRLAQWLIGQELADQEALDRIRTEVEARIEAAVQFALNAPYPSASEVDQHVYA